MKVLFITRKYPPQIGGMEKYSYDLIKNFPDGKEVIALKKSQINLFWFIPYALVKGIFLSRKVDLIYLCDSLIAPIGLALKLISKKPVLATAHGLDIIYDNWFYRNINVRALKFLDKVISVSQSTLQDCVNRGVNRDKCVFIPNAIEIRKETKNYTKKDLSKILNFDLSKKKVLFTLGRLTKRKGVLWFIENVFSELDDDIVYIIAGSGKEENNIKKVIGKKRMINRIIMLGEISDETKNVLYQTSDIFIMPNIEVKGDKEGFGIAALEAASCGLPVAASRIEGICDAIINEKNGFLVESGNMNEYAKIISKLLADDEKRKKIGLNFKKYTEEHYDWNKIILKYLEEFRDVLRETD